MPAAYSAAAPMAARSAAAKRAVARAFPRSVLTKRRVFLGSLLFLCLSGVFKGSSAYVYHQVVSVFGLR
jgi:hypothetical protein